MSSEILLAIETCFGKCSVCLYKNGNFYEKTEEKKNNHTNSLPQFTQELFNEHKITIQDLNGIIINHGPGSFTGIRIGIAFALGLTSPFQTPLYGISTNEAQILDTTPTTTIIHAIKNTAYIQEFQNGIPKNEIIHTEIEPILTNNTYNNPQFINFPENNPYNIPHISTPNAKSFIKRYLFIKPKIYSTPLYIRPINATIGAIKFIK